MTLKDFYSLLSRLFLGYVFFSSGLCKLADGHFGQLIGPPNLINDLEAYQLGGFATFLAFSQVMTGALVLSQRWSLLGLVMLVPMNASILAATLSMHWQGTPYVNGFLLTINLLALLYEWKTLRFFILPETREIRLPSRIQQLFPYPWFAAGVLITALMAAIFARLFPAGLIIAGVVTLVLAWLNVWRAVSFQWMAKIALLGSLFAVVSLALTEPLSHVGINVYVPMGGGILLATLATGACTFWIWLSKTNRMV